MRPLEVVDRALDEFKKRPGDRSKWTRGDFEKAFAGYRDVLAALTSAATRLDTDPIKPADRRNLSAVAWSAVNFLDEVTR